MSFQRGSLSCVFASWRYIDHKRSARVVVRRAALDELTSSIQKDDRVLVEGRLQTTAVKMDDGSEKRIYEIDANTIERNLYLTLQALELNIPMVLAVNMID